MTLAVTLPGAAGCVDPQKDYNDFVARLPDGASTGPSDDGGPGGEAAPPVEAGPPPDAGFSQTYAMACQTHLQPGAKSATLFTATATYVPAARGGGQFTFQSQTLKINATSLSDLVGTQFGPKTVQVDATTGTASVVFGPTTVVAAANPVTGTDATFGPDATNIFLVGENPLCAGVSGSVTAPLQITLDPKQGDVCILLPSTGTVPTFTDDMFTKSACNSL
jgi:hypothetical protein